MNLRQRLEERSVRGTRVGSAALIAGIESELGTHRRFNFVHPGVGFVAAALATLVLVGGVLIAVRPQNTPVPPADTTSTTATTGLSATTTSTTPQTTVPPTTVPEPDALTNRQFVWNWDPATGNLDELEEALDRYDGSPYDVIRLIEQGGLATHAVVFDYLQRPSPWRVQTLITMEMYGAPTGTPESPVAWPQNVYDEIRYSLELAASNTFGDTAELVIAVQRYWVESSIESCVEDDQCELSRVWYAVPDVVVAVTGNQSGLTYSGTIEIVSDTGTDYEVPFSAEYDDRWVVTDRRRPAITPSITIDQPRNLVSETSELTLSGGAGTDVQLSIQRWRILPGGGMSAEEPKALTVAAGQWESPAWETEPEPGDYEIQIHALRLDGVTETTSMSITYAPDAVGQFAFMRGLDLSGPEPALVVDYAELLVGDAAVQAAIEDGELPADQAEAGLDNDYYIRNLNPQLRTLSVEPGAPIYLFDYDEGEAFDYDAVTIEELVEAMQHGSVRNFYFDLTDYPVWLMVQDETILQLTPQYFP